MTQLKLRLTEADHLILKADLLLRVNHNESAQTKKENRKGESTSPKHPSVFVSGLGFPVTQQEWTFTWRWSWHNWFRSMFFSPPKKQKQKNLMSYMWWSLHFHCVGSDNCYPWIQRERETHGVHKRQLARAATNVDSLQHTEMKYILVCTEPQSGTLSVLVSFPC